MEYSFALTPRVLAHLGEDLIKNESIALLELVKNSYDANATVCNVRFKFESSELCSIIVEDNGDGMDLDTIQNVWLVVGTSNKQEIISNKCYKRVPLGEKGIGRLGVHKLGNKICLLTKKENDIGVRVEIDWNALPAAKSVDDFKIKVIEDPSIDFRGTRIYVTDLKKKWDRKSLRAVYRDLTSLNSPYVAKHDSFKVNVFADSDVFRGMPDINKILKAALYRATCRIEGNKITKFEYEFKPWKTLNRIQGRKITSISDLQSSLQHIVDIPHKGINIKQDLIPFSLDAYNIGPIDIEVSIFEKESAIFSLMDMERTIVNNYLRENGGIRVYRDDVRVYNYGEPDNDWLQLDARRLSRAGGNISNNIVIGAVSIDRLQSLDLKEKTNREGFIENDAYHAFVDAVKYVIDLIVQFRNEDKYRLSSIYKSDKKVVQPVLSDLETVKEIVDKRISEPTLKQEIQTILNRINSQYVEVRDILLHSANTGLNLSTVVHEMEKQVKALAGYAMSGDIEKIRSITSHLEHLVSGYSTMVIKSSYAESGVESIVKTVLENNHFRFKDHEIRVFSNRKDANYKAMMRKSEAISALNNLIDNSIYWVSKSRISDRMIYVYITDEFEGYITVAVCDNGPGFNIPTEMAVQPFVSGKPLSTGMGLGLHISSEVMKIMNGKLNFFDQDEINLPSNALSKGITKSIVALQFKCE